MNRLEELMLSISDKLTIIGDMYVDILKRNERAHMELSETYREIGRQLNKINNEKVK